MAVSSRSGIIILFATIVVCTFILFPILQVAVERAPQLSAYDNDKNDLSKFRESLETGEDTSYNVSAILSNPAVLEEVGNPSETLLIIAGTESPYTLLELEILAEFISKSDKIFFRAASVGFWRLSDRLRTDVLKIDFRIKKH